MRTVTLGTALAVVLATSSVFVLRPAPLLIWNASASAPRGLYRKAGNGALPVGGWVLLHAPAWAETLAAGRNYLPSNVALIKKIAAVGGDVVCRNNRAVTRNGRVIAAALDRDSQGRALPRWSGCARLSPTKIFVINTPPQSFDSRYFGPVGKDRVIEEIVPLWTF